jgi:histidinol-phosphate aminotransferase
MRLCDLAPAHIRAISPYQPGKPISELAREMGLAEASIVKLASNENPLGIGEKTRAAIEAALADIARYPDGNGFELKDALHRRYGVALDQIVLGNGSNDILELVRRAFLGPDREAIYARMPSPSTPSPPRRGRPWHRGAGTGFRP